MNKEAAKLHAKEIKVQHHNPQDVEFTEDTEVSEGDPSWKGGDFTEKENRET
jgi:hypothetical protein